MTGCEVCDEEVTEGHSDVPVDDEYYAYYVRDEEAEESPGLPKKRFLFCSKGCLHLFTDEPPQVKMDD